MFDGVPVRQQGVRGAIQLHGAHRFKVHPQQLAQGAALTQPGMGGPFRPRRRQAPDHRPQRGGPLRPGQPQSRQQGRHAQLLQRPQAHCFHPHCARPQQRQGIDRHAVHIIPRRFPHGRRRGAGQQLGGDPLCFGLQRRRTSRIQHVGLAGQHLLDAGTQRRPVDAVDVVVAAEVGAGCVGVPSSPRVRRAPGGR